MVRVFLCHSSQDKPKVRDLYRSLRRGGFTPWLDEENLIPGQDWAREIRREVQEADVVVVCLSQSSITKEGFVQKEIRIALDVADEKPDGTIFIIPARLENCEVPDRLGKWQWVNLFEQDGHDKLLRALRERVANRASTYTSPSVPMVTANHASRSRPDPTAYEASPANHGSAHTVSRNAADRTLRSSLRIIRLLSILLIVGAAVIFMTRENLSKELSGHSSPPVRTEQDTKASTPIDVGRPWPQEKKV